MMSPGVREIWQEIKRGRERVDREPHPDTVRTSVERAERLDQLEEQITELGAKLDTIAANTGPQPERRSQMSPARKSEIIRREGLEAYQRRPW
jgi:hypothetical protein